MSPNVTVSWWSCCRSVGVTSWTRSTVTSAHTIVAVVMARAGTADPSVGVAGAVASAVAGAGAGAVAGAGAGAVACAGAGGVAGGVAGAVAGGVADGVDAATAIGVVPSGIGWVSRLFFQ
mmetsp:Transcript_27915/g.86539  ORF Transcript_27915/g.86539 Transcript_27915/m.86539 type:complete len:120 (-) Transcript_27915:20-379(-)